MTDPTPASSAHHHRRGAPRQVPTVVITVSDTRTLETDTGGARVAKRLAEAGHPVVSREIVPDDPGAIAEALRKALSRDETAAVILTGGTGVAPRDVTPEAVEPLLERVIPGFGELFRMLSYEQVSAAAENFKVSFAVTKTQANYTVQHTANVYVISPAGQLLDVLTFTTSAEDLVAALR